MKSEEFGKFVFDFDDECGASTRSSNAGGSGSQGGCGGSGGCGGGGGCNGGSGHNSVTEQSPTDE